MSMRDYLYGRRKIQQPEPGASVAKIAIVSALLFLLLMLGLFLNYKSKSLLVPTDPATLCPSDRPPAEVVVILLDTSDELSEPQRLKISNELNRIRDNVVRFGLIEAYVVDQLSVRVPKPLLHICNPGSRADIDELYQNPEQARKRWDSYSRVLDAELSRLLSTPKSQTSAIFEAIQAVALRTLSKPEYDTIPKRLVVVSDLLQNVPGKLSQYDQTPTFEEFKATAYYADTRADLSNVSVTLLYLVRPGKPQQWPTHIRFWEDYFASEGADVSLVEPIFGSQ